MLLDIKQRIMEALQREPWVVCAWLFGSVLSGRARGDSDLDIAVLTGRKPSWQEYAELQQDLVQAVDSDAVDLVVLNEAGSILRFEAISGQLLFCRNPDVHAAFCSLTSREYEEDMAQIGRSYRMSRLLEG